MLKYCWAALFAIVLFTSGCKQASDLKAFTEARYNLKEMHDLRLNGIDVMQKSSPSDFTTKEGDSLLASISDNTLQAATTLYLHVQLQDTTEERQMTITQLKWQLLVDGEQTLDGIVETPLNLKNGVNKLPLQTAVKMAEPNGVRNYEGLSKLMTLVAQKKDLRRSLTLQIKPTVATQVGNLEVPDFITVSEP